MAFAGVNLTVDSTDLVQLQKSLRNVFDNAGLAATLESAIEKAIWPAYLRLRELTPVGPSGNLKRALAYKTKAYPRNGGAVGLIGYRQSGTAQSTALAGEGSTRIGPDRAFHQWWMEYGTKERRVTKVSNQPYTRKAHSRVMKSGKVAAIRQHQVAGQGAIIASSFKKRGQVFNSDGSLLPYAYFRKAKKGEQVLRLNPMPAGGDRGVPPVRTAWDHSKGQVAEILSRELSLSLTQALERLTFSGTGTLTGAVIQAGG